MITLPASPAPNGCSPSVVAFDITARPSTGAEVQTIFRPGSRFALDISFPLLKPDVSRVITSRLLRARREGLQINVPLLGVSQGSPGTPLIDGDYPSGTVLPLKGLTPGYQCKEGYWLTLIDAAGTHYLHRAIGDVTADGGGDATLSIETPIRAPLLDGATVLLAEPKVQGLVEQVGWTVRLDKLSVVSFTLEERA